MGVRPAETVFIGSQSAKVDAKGRIALPADFRRALDIKRFNGFYATPNLLVAQHLDCGGPDFLERIHKRLARLKPYAKERVAFEETLIGRMRPIPLDGDGRFILPAPHKEKARVTDSAFFIGLGDTFQIRNGADGEGRMKEHEDYAREIAHLLTDCDEEPAP